MKVFGSEGSENANAKVFATGAQKKQEDVKVVDELEEVTDGNTKDEK